MSHKVMAARLKIRGHERRAAVEDSGGAVMRKAVAHFSGGEVHESCRGGCRDRREGSEGLGGFAR
jgi:hypothetical protein